ncbi:MAG: proline dehydrogenase [Flavobacteriales bacterium]|nr:proline dehydrogenase [Flavobacteriales bacterium]|tara:strand:+ start:835 stop:2082 length:1248 start_codon:yes stop_codon:yes gene_type:complete
MSIFKNTEIAFKNKSTQDLNRAYLLFKAINNKILSFVSINLLKLSLYFNIPIDFIIKNTVFKQFCGGISINDCQNTIHKLAKSNIGTILDFSAEGKEKDEDFIRVTNEIIDTINEACTNQDIPFAVFKMTGITKKSILETLSKNVKYLQEKIQFIFDKENEINGKYLTKSEREIMDFLLRLKKICDASFNKNVRLFIDAEESWIQEAIDNIVIDLMNRYNKEKAIIFNTIQMYRVDRIHYLNNIINQAKSNDFFIGLKIVRGAYHDKEISKSMLLGDKSPPVYLNKKHTDIDFNKALKICIENIKYISICAGTHNENSCRYLIDLMKENQIDPDDNRIFFSQLLGMSDHISYNASNLGYNVSKYVPYGPVKEVIPYLIRRAEENTSIKGQMGRELKNIIIERKRRLHLNRNSNSQ